jgi:hypothetical protein
MFNKDILIQSEDPTAAAKFYVEHLGFEITGTTENMVSLEGPLLNLYIERGPPLGSVLEVFVEDVHAVRLKLESAGARILKDEPQFPRCYIQDPNGLIYNLVKKNS